MEVAGEVEQSCEGGGAPAHRASDAPLTSAAKPDWTEVVSAPQINDPGMSLRSQLTFATVLMVARVRLSYESQGEVSAVGRVKLRWMRPLQTVERMEGRARYSDLLERPGSSRWKQSDPPTPTRTSTLTHSHTHSHLW